MSRINAENPQEAQGAHVPNHHSNFNYNKIIYVTSRFGEYTPFFHFDSYEKDKIHQRSVTTTRSFSLKAPLMEDINMKRDYFQVYYDAILPINWDKCYIRPKQGDIVDWLKCSTNVDNFPQKVRQMCSAVWQYYVVSEYSSSADKLKDILRTLTFVEMFYSDGSLLSHFGCHLAPCFKATYVAAPDGPVTTPVTTGFDAFFDAFCLNLVNQLTYDGDPSPGSDSFKLSYTLSDDEIQYSVTDAISLRQMLTAFRDGSLKGLYTVGSVPSWLLHMVIDATVVFNTYAEFPLNLAPLWAYQMACAHFYSDDNVDYIFSAELFRSLIGNYCNGVVSSFNDSVDTIFFTYNGVRYQYDWLSGFFFDFICQCLLDNDGSFDVNLESYLRTLFGFNRSLRFQDYFAGARTRPIAIGDETQINVQNGKVSVINVTQSIQWQRLLNNIQRLPQEIGRYIKSATGKSQSFDYHNPGWLAHTSDTVFAAEVENTATDQVTKANSVTATLRGKSSNQQFTFESDRPCIIIGIQYFDIRRAYYTGVDRNLMLSCREEMFMPELQYIGDQPINACELFSAVEPSTFGYTEQYNWMKQTYDEAIGGFAAGSLPGWAFMFRPDFFRVDSRGRNLVISPNFIRSTPPELDEFFISLTGFSLGTYFHFQQKICNITSASRNMVKHSQILQ